MNMQVLLELPVPLFQQKHFKNGAPETFVYPCCRLGKFTSEMLPEDLERRKSEKKLLEAACRLFMTALGSRARLCPRVWSVEVAVAWSVCSEAEVAVAWSVCPEISCPRETDCQQLESSLVLQQWLLKSFPQGWLEASA